MTDEKKIHLKDIISGYSDLITAHSKLAGTYKHPTGTGDGREDALIEVLQKCLPEHLSANKCTVIDSDGNASSEIDIVIFEKSHCITPLVMSGRKVVPIESVLAVIEVKSHLDSKSYQEALDGINSLDRLTRYYEPIGYHPPEQFTQAHREFLKKGVKPQDQFPKQENMPKLDV